MTISTYNPYLLISTSDTDHTDDTNYTDVPNYTSDTSIYFGIVGMQTDNILSLSDDAFF